MALPIFSTITNKNRKDAVQRLIEQSTPRQDFFVMMLLSVMLAALGLILGNVAVIIGSMLVAPILYPVLSIAMGVVMADAKLLRRSFLTFAKAFSTSLVAAVILTFLFSSFYEGVNFEIIERTQATLPNVMIAILAGLAASLAFVKPNLNEMLPGVAIAVALVPPLATIGIGIATFNFSIVSGALLLFVVNNIGIIAASMVVFSFMNFYSQKDDADKIIKEEDKELKEEENKARSKES